MYYLVEPFTGGHVFNDSEIQYKCKERKGTVGMLATCAWISSEIIIAIEGLQRCCYLVITTVKDVSSNVQVEEQLLVVDIQWCGECFHDYLHEHYKWWGGKQCS